MNENKLQSLSALMDGEAGDADLQALDELSRDEGLRASWGRYHLISECIRGTLPRHMDPALAHRVALAVRQEPTVLAPDVSAPRPWLRPLAGMAIAASVATLAVVGIQMNRHQDAGMTGPGVAAAQGGGGSGGRVNLASGGQAPMYQRAGYGYRANDPRLNRYLINYSEQRGGAAEQSVPPNMRVLIKGKEQQ